MNETIKSYTSGVNITLLVLMENITKRKDKKKKLIVIFLFGTFYNIIHICARNLLNI